MTAFTLWTVHVPAKPDYTDLEDWVAENYPSFASMFRYIQPTDRYDAFYLMWQEAGRPTEGFESSLWTQADALGIKI